jgi:hypothetical protein
VPDEAVELIHAGVGVGVEMDDGHPAPADRVGGSGHVRPGDRVVAAEHHRDRAGLGHRAHRGLEPVKRHPRLDARHLDVAGVDDSQLLQGSTRSARWGATRRAAGSRFILIILGPKRAPARYEVPAS